MLLWRYYIVTLLHAGMTLEGNVKNLSFDLKSLFSAILDRPTREGY